MATPAKRRLEPKGIRRFGSGRESFLTPDLTKIQTDSYAAFLQDETPAEKRKDQGLEGVLREIFPIESYDKTDQARVPPVRAGQAAVHARRMPPVAADLRHARSASGCG